jgi:hypothetical protein
MIYIHQNPNLVKVGGFQNLGKSLFNNTKVSLSIPLVNGKFKIDLSSEELKKVNDYYGRTFEDKEFFSELQFPIADLIHPLDIENNVDNLITYKLGLTQGIIAANREAIEDPHCTAIFYVYDSDEHNDYKAKRNELKGDLIYTLTGLKRENKLRLIKVNKYLFSSYEALDENKAYNKLIDFIESADTVNNNLETLNRVLNLDESEVSMNVDIKEAIARNFILRDERGYFNRESTTRYGKNFDEIVMFMEANPDELGTGNKNDKAYSIRKLLLQGTSMAPLQKSKVK